MVAGGGTALTLSDITLDGARAQHATDADGGIVNVAPGKSLIITGGATLRNSATTGDGGAVYAASGSAVTVSGGAISGNTAANGAGIYLPVGGKLELSGNLSFGGTDRVTQSELDDGTVTDKAVGDLKGTDGNFVQRDASFKTEEDKEPTNGGKQYVKDGENYLVRQDIYMAGTASPITAINVTGKITSGDGMIWVWVENVNHYEMLKQFAVFSGDGTGLSDADKESTMRAFRNAQPDKETNCGGDYLTGQKGEVNNWIYWTGGFDVVFLKADSFGEVLSGATFTLYGDEACTTPFEMTFLNGKRATTVSSDGTATYKDKNGQTVTLEEGEVLLSKVPPKTFYLKETTAPEDFDRDENKTIYQVAISSTGVLTMRKKSSSAATSYDVEVFKETRQRTAGNLEQYVVMNIPEKEWKVILWKVGTSDNTTYASLAGAEFQILRYDQTPVSSTDASGQTTTTFTSGANGVYFIDTLPCGIYYLRETKAPVGYDNNNENKYFCLIIDEDGKYISEKCYPEQKDALADAQNVKNSETSGA
jgi:hypothetical protein